MLPVEVVVQVFLLPATLRVDMVVVVLVQLQQLRG
jgi:hypothetical protein